MKKILLAFSLFLIQAPLFANNFYWVGGNGNWSDFQHHWATTSGGAIFQTTIPTAFDDVYFDANSFPTSDDSTVTIDVSVAYTKKITFNTNQQSIKLNFINGALLQVYGSATFSDGVKLLNGLLYFKATTPGCQLTFNKSSDWVLSNIYFDGIGGSWQVTDSMVVANDIWLINGELDIAGKTVRSIYFYSTNSSARGWKFANAKLYFYGVELNSNNLSYTFTGSTIHTDYIKATGPQFNLNNFYFLRPYAYGRVTNISANVFTVATSSASLENCTLGKCYADSIDLDFTNCSITEGHWNKIRNVSINYTLEIGQLTTTGNDCIRLLNWQKGYAPATLKQTTGSFVFNYCAVRGITATGGATFSATNSRDEGGNAGISFAPHIIKTYYWIGNTGSGIDPQHWSLSSGGPVEGCLPHPLDTVVMDANSFNGAGPHYVNGITCGTLDTRTIDENVDLGSATLYGSIYLSPLLSFYQVLFSASTTGNKIDLNGAKSLEYSTISFNGTGSWSLLDSLYAQTIDQHYGYLYSNGQKIITKSYRNSFYGQGDFSHSTIVVGSFNYSNTGIFETSTFIFPNGGDINTNNIIGEILNYKSSLSIFSIAVKKFTSYADINASYITADSLNILQGSSIVFGILTTKSIKIIPSTASCSSLTVFRSFDPQDFATIEKTTGTLQLELVALVAVHASGGATFIANQSADLGDNDGWIFNSIASKTYYWINDGGDWEDPQHWSLTSGGNPEGCIPSIQDKVIFDDASFSGPNQVISKQTDLIQLSGFTVGNIPSNTALTANQFNMYGDITLSTALTVSQFSLTLMGKHSIHLTTGGAYLTNVTTTADSLFVMDDLRAGSIYMSRGYINAAHKNITSFSMSWNTSDTLVTDFTESMMDTYQASFYQDHLHFIGTNSYLTLRVRYSSSSLSVFQSFLTEGERLHLSTLEVVTGDFTPEDNEKDFFFANTIIENLKISKMIGSVGIFMGFSEVKKMTSFTALNLQVRNTMIHTAQLYANCQSSQGTIHVGYLKIAPGTRFEILSGDSLYIHEYLDAIGNSSFPITIEASDNGIPAYVYSAGTDLCFSYLNLSNTIAAGAHFYAGPNSSDIYNNSGWDFTNTCDVLTIDANLPACKQGAVTLTPIHPANITGFLWTSPDNQQSNSETLLIDPLTDQNTGVYTLSAGGQTRKILVDYEVKPDVSIYQSFATYQTSPSIQFNSIYYDNGMGYQINWYKNGALYSATNESMIFPTETGNYYAIVTTANGCDYQSNTIVFDNTFTLSTPIHLAAQLTNNLQALLTWQDVNTSENGFEVYFSTQPDQGYVLLGTTSATTYTHATTLAPGIYYYKIRAFKTPSFFSPYSNVASVTVTVTANQHALDGKDYLTLYPVPAEDELHVISSQGNIEQIVIYDQQGAIHLHQSFMNNQSVQLNIHSLQHGYYLIKVITNKATLNQKFMK